jgi:hypothetical protein
MSKKRFPQITTLKLDTLIERKAVELRGDGSSEEYRESGITNAQIVQAAIPEARKILAGSFDEMVADRLSSRVGQVLGKKQDDPVGHTLFAGLGLPALPVWVAIPPPKGDGGPDYWKQLLDGDPTPSELDRVIDGHDKDIEGRITENEKLRILRDTAKARGCVPDRPISTVFRLGGPPRSPALDNPRP